MAKQIQEPESRVPDPDIILASAARFLIEGREEDAASVLLSCSLGVWESGDTWYSGDELMYALHFDLTSPRPTYEILVDDDHPVTKKSDGRSRRCCPRTCT